MANNNNNNRPWMLKAPKELKEKLDKIRIERIKNGKDKQMTSYSRLCLAMSRHNILMNDLTRADLRDDTKGQMESGSIFNIFTFMITAFLFIVFCAGLIYVQGLLATVFHDTGVANPQMGGWTAGVANMTEASDLTFGAIADSIQDLRMVAAVYILALAISMIIASALQKINPMWFFVYILIAVLGLIFSAPLSNAYQDLYQSGLMNNELQNSGWGIANWVMFNLPAFILVLSCLGGIFLFINLIRQGNEAGGLPV